MLVILVSMTAYIIATWCQWTANVFIMHANSMDMQTSPVQYVSLVYTVLNGMIGSCHEWSISMIHNSNCMHPSQLYSFRLQQTNQYTMCKRVFSSMVYARRIHADNTKIARFPDHILRLIFQNKMYHNNELEMIAIHHALWCYSLANH